MEALSQPLTEGLDYGHPLEFGYFLNPDAGDPLGVLETARLVDGLGYDLLGVQDHPYQPRHLDTFSLLAAILAQTTAVRVFADVGNLPLRPPAVLAKAAATLDVLGPGRLLADVPGLASVLADELAELRTLPDRKSTRLNSSHPVLSRMPYH